MEYQKSKVISQKKVAPEIYVIEVALHSTADPGQFYMLKAWKNDLTLMRPISIFKIEKESVFFLYRVIGKGTERLSLLKKGAEIEVLGPLGNGFPCDQVSGKIALIGGGLGIPPMYETAKRLKNLGHEVDLFLGYRKELFVLDEFTEVCSNIFIASEKGKEGYNGFVTDLVDFQKYDAIFTCGPEPMMFKILDSAKKHNVPVWLSMEKRMGCGIGACLVCSCETKHGMQRSCHEGPVFNGYELIMEG